jgi:hypothetical protein
VRRLFWVVLLAGAACSEVSKVEPGSTDSFYRPTGIGVYAGKLVVASSNSDLLFDSATGGSVITVDPAVVPPDPTRVGLVGGILIQSFAAQMAIADPNDPRGAEFQCAGIPAPLAVVPVRGADLLYQIALGPDGAPSCGDGCVIPLAGHSVADPYSVGVACGGGIARLYVGYLRTFGGVAAITQIDLLKNGEVKSNVFGVGQMRSFAYDSSAKRLYAAQAGGIHFIDLAEDCDFEASEIDGGCHGGVMAIPAGLEAHAIALSRPRPGENVSRRLYVLARVFDAQAAIASGIRFGDVDGYLLVMDLAEDLAGQAVLNLVKPPIRIGYGPIAIALLPGRTGKRDVVAALTVDDPALLLFDDDNDASVVISRDIVSTPTHEATGHPWLGAQPFGLAVDPVPAAGVARVYVGSFQESYVTPIDVPLDDIEGTAVPPASPFTHIVGGTP